MKKTLIFYWSKTHPRGAVSNGVLKMNVAVKSISEWIGESELRKELSGQSARMVVCMGPNARNGMHSHRCSVKVKHLATEPLRSQGAVGAQTVDIKKGVFV